MRLATALFALAALAIIAFWAWLGAMVEMPQSPLAAGEKLHCISYAPFRAGQDPFGPDVPIDPRQIEEDLAQLKLITGCVRTYSTDHGLDQIPEIARRHGLKVMQGLWLSSVPDLTRKQIETGIALAKRYPDVIQAVIVGNEEGEIPLRRLQRHIAKLPRNINTKEMDALEARLAALATRRGAGQLPKGPMPQGAKMRSVQRVVKRR